MCPSGKRHDLLIGLFPPGAIEARSASAQLGKMYTFTLAERPQIDPSIRGRSMANESRGNPAVFADVSSRFDADAGYAVFSREDKQVDAFSQ